MAGGDYFPSRVRRLYCMNMEIVTEPRACTHQPFPLLVMRRGASHDGEQIGLAVDGTHEKPQGTAKRLVECSRRLAIVGYTCSNVWEDESDGDVTLDGSTWRIAKSWQPRHRMRSRYKSVRSRFLLILSFITMFSCVPR
jgi:hypothetical protein